MRGLVGRCPAYLLVEAMQIAGTTDRRPSFAAKTGNHERAGGVRALPDGCAFHDTPVLLQDQMALAALLRFGRRLPLKTLDLSYNDLVGVPGQCLFRQAVAPPSAGRQSQPSRGNAATAKVKVRLRCARVPCCMVE